MSREKMIVELVLSRVSCCGENEIYMYKLGNMNYIILVICMSALLLHLYLKLTLPIHNSQNVEIT